MRLPGNIILDLGDQRRNEVEVLMDMGKLVQEFHHPIVVLEGMEPDPREPILARDHVLVKGLVHVPKQHQPDFRGTVGHGVEDFAAQVYQAMDWAWNPAAATAFEKLAAKPKRNFLL